MLRGQNVPRKCSHVITPLAGNGWMETCFDNVFILMGPLHSHSRNSDSTVEAMLFQSSISQFLWASISALRWQEQHPVCVSHCSDWRLRSGAFVLPLPSYYIEPAWLVRSHHFSSLYSSFWPIPIWYFWLFFGTFKPKLEQQHFLNFSGQNT